MSKQLIVNADDFGRHILINRAVERGGGTGTDPVGHGNGHRRRV